MLTLVAIIPVFHQVEEVMEMKQEVLVEMITSATSAEESWSITQGCCRAAGVGVGWEQTHAQPRDKGVGKGSMQKPRLSLAETRWTKPRLVQQIKIGHRGEKI